MRAITLSRASVLPSAMRAALPGWSFSPSSRMKESVTPVSVSLPAQAPHARRERHPERRRKDQPPEEPAPGAAAEGARARRAHGLMQLHLAVGGALDDDG